MNQITAYIERASDGSFTISSPQVKGVYAPAPTVEEAQVEFVKMLGEQAEDIKDITGRWPEWYSEQNGMEIIFVPCDNTQDATNNIKPMMRDILNDISWRGIANRYFEKPASWLYEKMDGMNGGFDEQEKAKLKEALIDLSKRIKVAADGLN